MFDTRQYIIQYIRKPAGHMMASLHIDFEWWRDPAGYRMAETETGPNVIYHSPRHRPLRDLPVLPGQWGLAYHPIGIRVLHGLDHDHLTPLHVYREGGTLSPYRPLDLFGSLYAEFSKIRSADDVLYFIERFGPLTIDGLDNSKGELVDGVLAHSDAMRDLFSVLSRDRARRAKLIADLRMSPFADLDITLELDPASEDLKLRLCPTSLLDAVWLQAAQELSSGAAVRKCLRCDDWFETGPRTARRADAKFCSDEHRIAFNSLKRTKES
jgi:hypothetical protein